MTLEKYEDLLLKRKYHAKNWKLNTFVWLMYIGVNQYIRPTVVQFLACLVMILLIEVIQWQTGWLMNKGDCKEC